MTVKFSAMLILFLCFIDETGISQAPDSLMNLFRRDKTLRYELNIDSSFEKKGAFIDRISFISTDDFVVSAFITRPEYSSASMPLILFNHWGEGNKSEFLEEAIKYSSLGFLCLLPDAPWLCPDSKLVSFKRQGYELVHQALMNDLVFLDLATSKWKIEAWIHSKIKSK